MATKNQVPRADVEGGIGTALKRWLNGHISHLFATDISSADGSNTSTPEQIATAVSKAHDQSHKASHEPGGGDALTVDAAAATGSLRTLGTSSTSACAGNDSRLSDARTPSEHKASHQNGGSDEVATATAAANAIPKAGASGELDVAWIPTGTTANKVVKLDESAKLPMVDGSQLTNLPSSGVAADLWVPLVSTTDFSTTGDSTSTITMNSDQTANIKVGCMLKYTYNGIVYRGMCTAITSNLLTIAGAPIDTGAGLLTAVSYKKKTVEQAQFFVSGPFADAANTTLLASDMYAKIQNEGAAKYLVKWLATCSTDDTGANQPIVDVMVNSQHVCTSNSNTGLAISDASWVETVVDIDTTYYDWQNGEPLEIATDASGSNGDAVNLTVTCCFCDE